MSGVARKETGAGKKFQAYNVNDTYKGGRPEAKAPGTKGHGMTSLGKVQSRRMPGPTTLPSLRTENAGNDPNVNLVPGGQGGWCGGKENNEEKETSQPKEPMTWSSSGGPDPKSGAVPEHLREEFPTLNEQQKDGPRRDSSPGERRSVRRSDLYMDDPRGAHSHGTDDSFTHHYHGQKMRQHHHYGSGGPYHQPHPYYERGRGPHGHRGQRGIHHYPHSNHPPYSGDQGLGEFPEQRSDQMVSRPKIVKEEELKNLDLTVDEDDGGWAGHHDEVDYSKEVVFVDSEEESGGEQEKRSSGPRRSSNDSRKPPKSHSSVEGTGVDRTSSPLRQPGSYGSGPWRAPPDPRRTLPYHHQVPQYEGRHPPPHGYSSYNYRQHPGVQYGDGRQQWEWSGRHPAPHNRDADYTDNRGHSIDEGGVYKRRQKSPDHATDRVVDEVGALEDLEGDMEDFTEHLPSKPNPPRQQLRIMMREIVEEQSQDKEKDVPVTSVQEVKQPQGWSVTAKPLAQAQSPDENERVAKSPSGVATIKSESPSTAESTKFPWDTSVRGPVTAPRTLYEPEGPASVKKFTAYKRIHDNDTGSEKRRVTTPGDHPGTPESPATPLAEGKLAIFKGDKGSSSTNVESVPTATKKQSQSESSVSRRQQRSSGEHYEQHGGARYGGRGGGRGGRGGFGRQQHSDFSDHHGYPRDDHYGYQEKYSTDPSDYYEQGETKGRREALRNKQSRSTKEYEGRKANERTHDGKRTQDSGHDGKKIADGGHDGKKVIDGDHDGKRGHDRAHSDKRVHSRGTDGKHDPTHDRGDDGRRDYDKGREGRRTHDRGHDGRREQERGRHGRQDPNRGGDGRQDPNRGGDGRQDPNRGGDGRQDPKHRGGDGRQDPNRGGDGRQDPNRGGDGRQDPKHRGGDGRQDPNRGGDRRQYPNRGGDRRQDHDRWYDGRRGPDRVQNERRRIESEHAVKSVRKEESWEAETWKDSDEHQTEKRSDTVETVVEAESGWVDDDGGKKSEGTTAQHTQNHKTKIYQQKPPVTKGRSSGGYQQTDHPAERKHNRTDPHHQQRHHKDQYDDSVQESGDGRRTGGRRPTHDTTDRRKTSHVKDRRNSHEHPARQVPQDASTEQPGVDRVSHSRSQRGSDGRQGKGVTDKPDNRSLESSQAVGNRQGHTSDVSSRLGHASSGPGRLGHASNLTGRQGHTSNVISRQDHTSNVTGRQDHTSNVTGRQDHTSNVTGRQDHTSNVTGRQDHTSNVTGRQGHTSDVSGRRTQKSERPGRFQDNESKSRPPPVKTVPPRFSAIQTVEKVEEEVVVVPDNTVVTKGPDISQFDLHSHSVHIIDNDISSDIEVLSPVDESDFTEVKSKRDKREKKEKSSEQLRTQADRQRGSSGKRSHPPQVPAEKLPSKPQIDKAASHPKARGKPLSDPPSSGKPPITTSEVPHLKSVTYSKPVSQSPTPSQQLSAVPVPSRTEIWTIPTPSPGVIGSGILSPTVQSPLELLRTASSSTPQQQQQLEEGGYSLFDSGPQGVLREIVSSPVGRTPDNSTPPATEPSGPPRIITGGLIGKAVQDISHQSVGMRQTKSAHSVLHPQPGLQPQEFVSQHQHHMQQQQQQQDKSHSQHLSSAHEPIQTKAHSVVTSSSQQQQEQQQQQQKEQQQQQQPVGGSSQTTVSSPLVDEVSAPHQDQDPSVSRKSHSEQHVRKSHGSQVTRTQQQRKDRTDRQSGDRKVDKRSHEQRSDQQSSSQKLVRHPSDRHPSDRHPGDRHPGDRHPGDRHPGDRRTSDHDTGRASTDQRVDRQQRQSADKPQKVSNVKDLGSVRGHGGSGRGAHPSSRGKGSTQSGPGGQGVAHDKQRDVPPNRGRGAHPRPSSESQPGHRAQQREPHGQLVRGGHSEFPPGQTRSTSSQKGQPTSQTGSSLGRTRPPTSKTGESPSQKGPPLDQARIVARSQKDPVSREDMRVLSDVSGGRGQELRQKRTKGSGTGPHQRTQAGKQEEREVSTSESSVVMAQAPVGQREGGIGKTDQQTGLHEPVHSNDSSQLVEPSVPTSTQSQKPATVHHSVVSTISYACVVKSTSRPSSAASSVSTECKPHATSTVEGSTDGKDEYSQDSDPIISPTTRVDVREDDHDCTMEDQGSTDLSLPNVAILSSVKPPKPVAHVKPQCMLDITLTSENKSEPIAEEISFSSAPTSIPLIDSQTSDTSSTAVAISNSTLCELTSQSPVSPSQYLLTVKSSGGLAVQDISMTTDSASLPDGPVLGGGYTDGPSYTSMPVNVAVTVIPASIKDPGQLSVAAEPFVPASSQPELSKVPVSHAGVELSGTASKTGLQAVPFANTSVTDPHPPSGLSGSLQRIQHTASDPPTPHHGPPLAVVNSSTSHTSGQMVMPPASALRPSVNRMPNHPMYMVPPLLTQQGTMMSANVPVMSPVLHRPSMANTGSSVPGQVHAHPQQIPHQFMPPGVFSQMVNQIRYPSPSVPHQAGSLGHAHQMQMMSQGVSQSVGGVPVGMVHQVVRATGQHPQVGLPHSGKQSEVMYNVTAVLAPTNSQTSAGGGGVPSSVTGNPAVSGLSIHALSHLPRTVAAGHRKVPQEHQSKIIPNTSVPQLPSGIGRSQTTPHLQGKSSRGPLLPTPPVMQQTMWPIVAPPAIPSVTHNLAHQTHQQIHQLHQQPHQLLQQQPHQQQPNQQQLHQPHQQQPHQQQLHQPQQQPNQQQLHQQQPNQQQLHQPHQQQPHQQQLHQPHQHQPHQQQLHQPHHQPHQHQPNQPHQPQGPHYLHH